MKTKDISNAWKCSPSYVARLKRRGMPVDSLEAATRWRAAHAREGFSHKQRRPVPPDAIAAAVANLARALPPPDSTRASDDDPLSAVQRARRTEKEIYLLVELATEEARRDRNAAGALPGLLRTAAQANTNRLSAEARFERNRRDVGELAPVAELNATLDAALEPLASYQPEQYRAVSWQGWAWCGAWQSAFLGDGLQFPRAGQSDFERGG